MPKKKIPRSRFLKILDHPTGRALQIYTLRGTEVSCPLGMPDHVIVLGRRFEIRYHTKIFFNPKKKDQLNGCVIFDHRVIFIDPQNSIHAMRQTLLHEVLHIYFKNAKVKNLTCDMEEILCDALGWGMYDFMQNNKAFAVSCRR